MREKEKTSSQQNSEKLLEDVNCIQGGANNPSSEAFEPCEGW